jgi:hypothetical protein
MMDGKFMPRTLLALLISLFNHWVLGRCLESFVQVLSMKTLTKLTIEEM